MFIDKTRSLSFRINAVLWSVCTGVMLIAGFFLYGLESQQHQTQIRQVDVLVGAVYQQKREELANEIFSGHRDALKMTLAEIQAVKGIEAVMVFDLKGNPLAWTGEADVLRSIFNSPHRLQHPLFEETAYMDRPGVRFATEIEVIGERLGYFSAFFDLSNLQQASRQRILFIAGIFFSLVLILTIVLHLLLTRTVIRPVTELRKAMDRVMKGHLGAQVERPTDTEIGIMARAFNSMSTQLREQHRRVARSMQARDSYAAQMARANRELERLNTDLESMVEERTHELRQSYEKLQAETQERMRADRENRELEERLARSKKMEALGLLAGGVAHDLNNVLSGIVSYPELILIDMKIDHPLRPMLLTVQRSGQKAAAIVQDLLALARRGVTSMAVLNLNDSVIRDYLDSPEFKKLCAFHPQVEIKTDLSPELLNINGSGIHLKKAVMNLISNAAEAQPNGGHIIIRTENRYLDRPLRGYEHVTEGDYVVLRVEDKGMGIAPEDMERIFEPFYTKKMMGRSGTGLGMAVVWGTVQDHQGYINVESLEGEGTCFELFFPITREAPQIPDEAPSIEIYKGDGESVLVIDDVPEQREIVTALLSRLNYRVTAVESGEKALEYLQDNTADILVLDMIMDPGMDGLDTYTRILQRYPDQLAVIASGYAENERVRETQRLGAGAYIRKPYTLEKIAVAIRTELRPREKQSQNPDDGANPIPGAEKNATFRKPQMTG
jgi:signal transduction histidine kinase/ActR/RegA family two-component response regulator